MTRHYLHQGGLRIVQAAYVLTATAILSGAAWLDRHPLRRSR